MITKDKKYQIQHNTNIYYSFEGEQVKGKILLKFKYDFKIKEQIKQIPKYWWHGDKKYWSVPYTDSNLEAIQKLGFTEFETKKEEPVYTAEVYKKYVKINKENRGKLSIQYLSKQQIKINVEDTNWLLPNNDHVKNLLTKVHNYKLVEVKETEVVEDWRDITLLEQVINHESKYANPTTGEKDKFHHFQLEAIKFIQSREGKAIIGDEMGTGKTIEALGYLLNNPKVRPALIICKASAKLNWQKEIQNWLYNELSYVLKGGKDEALSTFLFSIYIINYDILSSRLSQIITEIKPKVIITDECQAVKNVDANRTIAFKELCKGTQIEKKTGTYHIDRSELQIIPMSGTPIVNRPKEFFTILNILDPKGFPSWEFYKGRYCQNWGEGVWGKRMRKDRMLELNKEVSNIMIRRKKEDVLKELPAKVRTITSIEIDNREEYKQAEKKFIEWVHNNYGLKAALKAKRAEQLVRINRLKKLTAEGKLKNIIKWIDDFLESDEKLIVFCAHRFMVDELERKYKNVCVKLVGGMSTQEKQNSVDIFQTDPNKKLFIGNLIAAGDSITLTAASNVANVYYLTANETIEDYLVKLINEKMKTLDMVLDGKEDTDESSMLDSLMEIYSGK
jgi:SNF2 family DNA or RNA helicase